MKKTMTIAALVCLALAGCGGQGDEADVTAAEQAPSVAATMPATTVDPAATAALRTFEGRDADRDGFVSSFESAAAADRIFRAIDTDQDGAVTAQEYTAARVALGLTSLPGSEELIAAADQDGDGQLTLAEWIASESRAFANSDRNGDGKLDHGEWDAMPLLGGTHPVPSANAAPAEK